MIVRREIALAAAPEAIYDVVMDPARLGDWVTIHRGLKLAPRGALREGSEMVQSLSMAGLPFDVHWTVVRAERPRDVTWEGRGPARSHARIGYRLRPGDGGGTRFAYSNELELPGGRLGVIASIALSRAPIADREVDRSLERLRSLVESG